MLGRRGTVKDPALRPLLLSKRRLDMGDRRGAPRERGRPTMLPRSSPRFLNQSPTSRKESPPERRGGPKPLPPVDVTLLPAASLRCICSGGRRRSSGPAAGLQRARSGGGGRRLGR